MALPRQGGELGLEIATSATPPADEQWKLHRQTPPEDAGPRNDKAGEEWVFVVEDVKSDGTRTREYSMKRKLLAEKFGIQIREI